MNEILKTIRVDRSNIKENSLNAYVSNINKVFKEVFNNDIDVKHFNQFKKVHDYAETLTPATRKNIIIAIIILLKAYKTHVRVKNKYQKYFDELALEYENNANKQLKSEKDEKNWNISVVCSVLTRIPELKRYLIARQEEKQDGAAAAGNAACTSMQARTTCKALDVLLERLYENTPMEASRVEAVVKDILNNDFIEVE